MFAVFYDKKFFFLNKNQTLRDQHCGDTSTVHETPLGPPGERDGRGPPGCLSLPAGPLQPHFPQPDPLGSLTEVGPVLHTESNPPKGPPQDSGGLSSVFRGELAHSPCSPELGSELKTKRFSSPILNLASHYPGLRKGTRISSKQHLQQLDKMPAASASIRHWSGDRRRRHGGRCGRTGHG